MNQRVLAGIGNIYADEILFQAGLHPKARVDRLKEDTAKELPRRGRCVPSLRARTEED